MRDRALRMRMLLVFMVLSVGVLLLRAAPAPLPPRPKPLQMVGVWRKWWSCNEQTYLVVFHPGGRYEAHLGNSTFRGTWRVQGRTLHVEESCGGSRLEWSLSLGTNMAGTTDTGVDVRFEPAEL